MEQDYSNREIREFFADIKDALSRIEAQTTRHNGQLTKIEAWRSYTAGGLAAIAFMGAPLLWYLFNQIQTASAAVARIEARFPEGISTSLVNLK